MRPRLWIALLAVAAAVALVLVASSSDSGGPLDPVARAADTTMRAGGAHMSIAGSLTATGLPQPIRIAGDGAFNFKAREGDLSLTISGLPQAAQSALHGSSLEMTELFKSTSLYLGSSMLAGQLPGGARWVRLDVGKLQQAFGIDPSSLTSGLDPTEYLQYLDKAGYGSKVVGLETVRGAQTTHYTGTLDLLKAAEAQPLSDRGELRRAVQKLMSEAHMSSLPVDVWVDGRGLVRRMAMTMTLSLAARSMTIAMQIEYFDFGPTPSVTVPSGSEVFDVTGQTLQHIGSGG